MGQHVPQIFQLLFNGELYEWQTKFYICPTKINIKVVGHMSNYLKITLVRTLVTCLTTAPASQHVHQCTRHPMQAHRHAQTTAPALEHMHISITPHAGTLITCPNNSQAVCSGVYAHSKLVCDLIPAAAVGCTPYLEHCAINLPLACQPLQATESSRTLRQAAT